MQEESNPIKDYLFEYIKNSKTIPKLVAEKRFDAIIEDVTRNCYDQTSSMGQKDEAVGILATGLLHYLLTSALISSQRKIKYGNQEIDIVIPDIKTLQKDPKKSLIICIPKSSDRVIIENKISEPGKNPAPKRQHMGGPIRETRPGEEDVCIKETKRHVLKDNF